MKSDKDVMRISTHNILPNWSVTFLEIRDCEMLTATLVSEIGAGQAQWPEGGVHLLEHLLVNQTGQSSCTGFTDREKMWIQFTCWQNEMEVIPETIKKIFDTSFLTSTKIEHEKKIILAEIDYRNTEQSRIFSQAWSSLVWKDFALQRTRIGEVEKIQRIDLTQVKAMHFGFTQQQHRIFIMGNVCFLQTALLEMLEKILLAFNFAQIHQSVRNPESVKKAITKKRSFTSSVRISREIGFGWVIPIQNVQTQKQRFLYELAQISLIRSPESFIHKVICQQLGAVYMPENLSKLYATECVIGVGFRMRAEVWNRAEKLLNAGKNEFIKRPISERELTHLKHRLIKRAVSSLENAPYFPYWFVDHSWMFPEQLFKDARHFWEQELAEVVPSDLENFLKTALRDENQRQIVI